jgi:hypothetical protein
VSTCTRVLLNLFDYLRNPRYCPEDALRALAARLHLCPVFDPPLEGLMVEHSFGDLVKKTLHAVKGGL